MSPLELSSPRWGLLQDAYGTAEQIPQLLAELESANAESFNELFGRICHQMSVYSSSIAAFPHLIAVASRLAPDAEFHADVLCLAGAICESDDFERELHQSEFSGALMASLPSAVSLAEAALIDATDQNQAINLLKSIAAFGRMQELARVLEGFSNEEFTLECPSCVAQLYVWPSPEGFFIAAEDPVTYGQAERTNVAPGVSTQSKRQNELRWLDKQSSGVEGLAEVRTKLPYLFGEALCPKCKHAFPLFDVLAEQAS